MKQIHAAILGAALAVPATAHAQNGMSWGYFSGIDEATGQTMLTAAFGVPETDDRAIFLSCEPDNGGGGPYVNAVFSALTGPFENDAEVPVLWRTQDGSARQYGVVVLSEMVGGFTMRMEADAFLLSQLATAPEISYGLMEPVGMTPTTLSLTADQAAAQQFLSECLASTDASQAAPTPLPVPIEIAQPGQLSCDLQGQMVSQSNGVPLDVTFVNTTDEFRGLIWIDPQGNFVDVGAVQSGESASFTTDTGHVWMITDGPGNCLEMMQPVPGRPEYQISAPSAFFGNE